MLRNCMILGSGRSGTSLAAGLLAKMQYFMGDELYPADDGNPKGYYEDREINAINEGILAQLLPGRKRTLMDKLMHRPRPHQAWNRWLAEIPLEASLACPSKLADRIRLVTARKPFCFKDPRFSYTLAAWRPFIADALLLCVFREPGITATSIVNECKRAEHLKDLNLDFTRALRLWESMYRHVLELHYPRGGDWLFIHYNQLINGTAHAEIETRLGVSLDREFADPTLRRSKTSAEISSKLSAIYRQLCNLAHYTAD